MIRIFICSFAQSTYLIQGIWHTWVSWHAFDKYLARCNLIATSGPQKVKLLTHSRTREGVYVRGFWTWSSEQRNSCTMLRQVSDTIVELKGLWRLRHALSMLSLLNIHAINRQNNLSPNENKILNIFFNETEKTSNKYNHFCH